jgi:chaperonin GroES
MKIRPLNDRILVKRLEEEETTAGGIIIPDSAKEKPAEGEIVSVGPGKMNDAGQRAAMDVKAGDRVLFSKYGGTDVKLDGDDYLIMREDDILGVIEG